MVGKADIQFPKTMLPSNHLLEILSKLNLPVDRYVLFGGAVLAIRDLREIGDLDIYVDRELWNELEARGWKLHVPRIDDPPFLERIIDGIKCHAFYAWTRRKWSPDLNYYLTDPEWIEGYPFIPLEEIQEWKERTKRKKDAIDLEMIDEYLACLV